MAYTTRTKVLSALSSPSRNPVSLEGSRLSRFCADRFRVYGSWNQFAGCNASTHSVAGQPGPPRRSASAGAHLESGAALHTASDNPRSCPIRCPFRNNAVRTGAALSQVGRLSETNLLPKSSKKRHGTSYLQSQSCCVTSFRFAPASVAQAWQKCVLRLGLLKCLQVAGDAVREAPD